MTVLNALICFLGIPFANTMYFRSFNVLLVDQQANIRWCDKCDRHSEVSQLSNSSQI